MLPRSSAHRSSAPRSLLLCQAPFCLFPSQLRESTPKTPAPNFADHFPPPAHTQAMSTNSKYGRGARCSDPARRISTRSFQGPQSPRVQSISVQYGGSAVAKITRTVIFPTKKPKSDLNSFAINKSLQNPCRFFSFFLDFCARNSSFWSPNRRQATGARVSRLRPWKPRAQPRPGQLSLIPKNDCPVYTHLHRGRIGSA